MIGLVTLLLCRCFDETALQLSLQRFLDENRIEMVSQVNCLDFPSGIMLRKVFTNLSHMQKLGSTNAYQMMLFSTSCDFSSISAQAFLLF